MLRKVSIFSCLFVCFLLLAKPSTGQVVGEPYRLNDKEVDKILKRIEQQSDHFRSSLDSALDKSRLNGSNREDDINSFVKEFYKETKTLRDRFDHHKSTAPDVQNVLDRASRIDSFMRRYPLNARAQNDWSTLKTNLDELASAYNVSWRWAGYSNDYPAPGPTYPTGSTVGGLPYRLSDHEVDNTLRQLEKDSDKFRSALDSSLDKSRFDGKREEDDINRFVKEFYEQTKTLRNHFDSHKSTGGDVQSVLDRAARIDSFMRRNPLPKKDAMRDWQRVREDLDQIAGIYNVSWRWGY